MRTVSDRTVLVVGLLVALTLAGVVSFYASGSPDGLNRVAADLGFAETQQASATQGGPLAGYETAGIDNSRWSSGVAGVLGCLLVLGCSWLLFGARGRDAVLARTEGE
ncbi:MAG: cobalt transport protein CbiN [Nocardioides sp.]|uniref:PDGLE domain-containing protein n=1 Tax=Nocardioides sp. TaxID=35761 RepID=UPI0026352F6C|nr:PDGLE domain-containing protein [Nocardioides sp.]MCW2835165.1 cobalt transport protein CbiN [Nocardioides sp.]